MLLEYRNAVIVIGVFFAYVKAWVSFKRENQASAISGEVYNVQKAVATIRAMHGYTDDVFAVLCI